MGFGPPYRIGAGRDVFFSGAANMSISLFLFLAWLMSLPHLQADEKHADNDWATIVQRIHARINREPEQVLAEVDPLIETALVEGNTAVALDLLTDKVWSARLASRYQEAIRAGELGIRMATEIGDKKRLALLYNHLGAVYWSLHDWSSAMDFWNRALELYEQIHEPLLQARTLNNIALIYQERKELHKAKKWLQRSLQTALRHHETEMLVVLYGNLGDVELELGNLEEAKVLYEKAQNLAAKLQDKRALAVITTSLARLALREADHERAALLLDQAWSLSRDLGNRRKQVEILRLQADIQLRQGKPERALELLERAKAIAADYGRINDQIVIYEQMARIHAEMGQWQQAYESLRKELDLSNRWLEQQKEHTLLRLQTQFEWQDQQRRLSLMQARQLFLEAEHDRDARERRWLLAAVLFFATLVVILGWILRQKVRLHAMVEAKNRELENIRRVLQAQARIDPLTRLYNRRAFMEKLRVEMSRMRRTKNPAGLALLDLDHFKEINDHYGHMAGDMILRGVASRMRNTLRDVDVLARWGGEEFIVLMPDTDLDTATRAAERLRRYLSSKPYEAGGKKIALTVTIGVTAIPYDCPDFQRVYKAVDEALYAGKTSGRNRVVSRAIQKTNCEDERDDA